MLLVMSKINKQSKSPQNFRHNEPHLVKSSGTTLFLFFLNDYPLNLTNKILATPRLLFKRKKTLKHIHIHFLS